MVIIKTDFDVIVIYDYNRIPPPHHSHVQKENIARASGRGTTDPEIDLD